MSTVELRADCGRCVALCCVVPAFTRSAQFAITKAAGTPCPKLADHRCTIHDRLRGEGFAGCVAYDCFGAGQRVTAELLDGRDWRMDPGVLTRARRVFGWARRWHEVAWYLDAAVGLGGTEVLRPALLDARDAALDLAVSDPGEVEPDDAQAQRDAMDELLRRASELVRGRWPQARQLRGASLVAAQLRRADLRGANLRGAVLLGADLSEALMDGADLTGADLRGASLRGADLRGAIFVTQAQLETAAGDRQTRLPLGVQRPAHW